MLYHPVPEVRSSCYRILRHLIVNYDSLILLGQLKLLIFIITSLANDQYKASLIEMTQALKLIRQYLTIDKGADLLSVGVIKALIAVIEGDLHDHNHTLSAYGLHVAPIPEGFKNACLETICEILSQRGVRLYKIPVLGDTFEHQLFDIIFWADFASYFLGLAKGVDVVSVEIIEQLKQAHRQKGIR